MSDPPSTVHVVVPAGIDDPARPSGGNLYDRRLSTELSAAGWSVVEHEVAGSWPDPLAAHTDALSAVLSSITDDGVVLLDGLVASAAAPLVARYAARLRLVVLVHLPLGVATPSRRAEEQALLSEVGVVTTSEWTRSWLITEYGLEAASIRAAVPGTDPADPVTGSPAGTAFLCVGAVTPTKGQDVLVGALRQVADLSWTCTCVGSLGVDPAFAESVQGEVARADLGDRVRFTGPLVEHALDAAYREADVLLLPSLIETYGMVVTEALSRGMPVIATSTGGTSEALGRASDGTVPGLLVPPGDAGAFASAIRDWLGDASLRGRLREAAGNRGPTLSSWADTAAVVARALTGG